MSLLSAIYGAVLLFAAIGYYILQWLIIAETGHDSKLASSFGRDWKGKLSPLLYAVGIGLSFFRPWAAGCIYVLVALLWLIPDCRIERVVDDGGRGRGD